MTQVQHTTQAAAGDQQVIFCPEIEQQLHALTCALRGHMPEPAAKSKPSAEVASRLADLRAMYSLKDSSLAAVQWERLSTMERRILVAYAGLRESNPGASVQSMAEFIWPEFMPAERAAIADAVRHLRAKLNGLSAIASHRLDSEPASGGAA